MTPEEILDTVKEHQTTDSISRKSALFNLIRQKTWEVWFLGYQYARKLYLEYHLPAVGNLLKQWGPVESDLEKYENGCSCYTQIDIHSPAYQHHVFDDEIILYGLTEEGVNIGLPASISVTFRMFNPDYLDYRIREIKPYLHYKLRCEIYSKEQELKQLQDIYKQTENPILSKLKTAESGTILWYERWYKGRLREAKEVKFVRIENGNIIIENYDGIEVSFDHNGTATSENDYTSACMLFPSSDHKRWDDVTYVPASKQKVLYE
ncbi:hypothetical protein E4T81_12390 [Barnesiella sp. WM24]|uniref:hypothetical protein n=1 Tax=Barnesiella sp. WM24 TaxID=2558278 RepID=UPI001071D3CD|nr:hypothetical protein [Barnesiella sp. WM24]TFU92381.1 hypothetical protein E4T81_12390 [Barnesiella sp. WM24]